MSKIISEYDGKRILDFWLPRAYSPELRSGTLSSAYSIPDNLSDVEPGEFDLRRACNEAITVDLYAIEKYIEAELKDLDGFKKYLGGLFAAAAERSPWVKTEKLVCKVDQAIKGRGKLGLVALNKTWEQVCAWITEVSSKRHNIGLVEGYIVSYTIEPFHPHVQEEEFYLSIGEERECDTVLFSIHGGMDIGDADARCKKLSFPLKSRFSIQKKDVYPLLTEIKSEKIADAMAEFIKRLLVVFECLYFSMIEINPLVVKEIKSPEGSRIEISILDLAAKLDSAAFFECSKLWLKSLSNTWRSPAYPAEKLFPRDFGRISTREEEYIEELDSKTGASLKFTILNPNGRIWTLVAGGGASVVYADAIASLGYSSEMANYGEYSGAPGESQTYEYSKTIIDLMTRCPPHKDGKILFIGGGIANFTNVVSTFKGIVAAITEYRHALKAQNVKIYVRRAGPNYQEGLKLMRSLGESLDLFIKVYGPESPITEMVPIALGKKVESSFKRCKENKTNGYSIPKLNYPIPTSSFRMTSETTAIVYGMQPRAVQGMLDFDYLCKRSTPSVACIVYPFGGHYFQKFYLGTNEILIPVFTSISKAREKFPKVNTVINFSSFRSVYSSTMQIMSMPGVEMVTIIAEGVPMKHSRHIIQSAKQKNILILGPATVGGISAGRFKIGNTGGMMDNIIASKLYRPGSVSYVSKSGGMSNELNNIISNCADGVCEGVAIGGDRYPGSVFMDHIYRYENDPMCKIIVLLGEIGGVEELYVAEAIKNKHVTKPVIVWCIGTCADLFKTNIQFGHAGSLASSALETSVEKNRILKLAGAYVPDTFEEIPQLISSVYNDMVKSGVIKKFEEPEVPKIPIDYAWAQELGLIRKPASFISTICDDRGEELLYAGMTINDIFNEDIGIGGVLSLLWFKRRLPSYATEFIEMVLMIIADHGPAVSGAHNTIVTARAGKDLISSLVSGLLTIGDRFGGALDGAARDFSAAYDQNLSPAEFVDKMRKENKLILGIGHKIKSLSNPDHRVRLIKKYVKEKFPFHNTLDYALEVEKITTSKKDNLILNVDGVVGAAFVDLLRGSGAFSPEEAEEYISIGTLNGLFVLGRSIGFIGHFLDQKRLKQGLYRHPWDDISYMSPENSVKDSERTRTLAESSIVMERGPGMQ